MIEAKRSALVLFAHGARDPEWSVPFRKIRSKVAARCRGLTVELAFLEFTPPTLADAVGRLAGAGHVRITIAPLFMAQGGHVKQDLPRLVAELQARYPKAALELLPAVGEVDAVLDAVSDWLVNTAGR